jgi:hypothetical protein
MIDYLKFNQAFLEKYVNINKNLFSFISVIIQYIFVI